jgi:formylmethanofuran dehydrogenase subunit D
MKQGRFAHSKLASKEYRDEVNAIILNDSDLEELCVKAGDLVTVRTRWGEGKYRSRKGDVPRKVGFIPYGMPGNKLVGPETKASGMPAYKGLKAIVEGHKAQDKEKDLR